MSVKGLQGIGTLVYLPELSTEFTKKSPEKYPLPVGEADSMIATDISSMMSKSPRTW